MRALYTHLKPGICDDGKNVPHHRHAENISIEMMLYIDLYLAVQDILTPLETPSQETPSQESPSQETPAEETSAQVRKVRKDYHDLWQYVARNGRVHRMLKAPFVQVKRDRTILTSFLRDPLIAEESLVWLSSDPIWYFRVADAKLKEGREDQTESLRSRNRYDFITMNPFLAGMILFVAVHTTCDLSLLTQNTDGLVLGYAYLFNFLQQAHSANKAASSDKLLTREWEDLETAIALFGESTFFKSNRPITLDMCTQRLLLQRELPALLFPLDILQSRCFEINKKFFAALSSTMTQSKIHLELWMNWQEKGTIPINLLFYERGYHKQSQALGPIPKDVIGVYSLPMHEAAEVITDYLDELRRDGCIAQCKSVLNNIAK